MKQQIGRYKLFYFLIWVIILLVSLYLAKIRKHKTVADYVPRQVEVVEDTLQKDLSYGSMEKDFFNLESTEGLLNTGLIKEGKSFSGSKSCCLSDKDEYGITYLKKISSIPNFNRIRKINYKVKVYPNESIGYSLIVFEISSPEGKSLDWQSKPIKADVQKWNDVTADFLVDRKLLQEGNSIKLYVWNKEKKSFCMDDIEVVIEGMVPGKKQEESILLAEIKPTNFFFDFEPGTELTNSDLITTDKFHSGKQAIKMDGHHSYSPTLAKQIKDIGSGNVKSVSLSIWFYPLTDNSQIVLVASASDASGKEYSWNGKDTKKYSFKKNNWYKLNAEFNFPMEKNKPENKISAYVWNKGGSTVYLDDFEIVFKEPEKKYTNTPNVVIDPFKEFTYSPQRNKPPFQTSFLVKTDIGNLDGVFLTDNKIEKEGELLPDDQLMAGNFMSDSKGLDELFRINSSLVELFGFCSAENSFKKIWSERNRNEIKNWNDCLLLKGDFNHDGRDELLKVGKDKKIQLLSFSDNNKANACQGVTAQAKWNILWSGDKGEFPGWTIDEKDLFLSGDFNGDGVCDLVVIKPATGDFIILEYHANSWQNIISHQGVAKNKIPVSATTKILSVYFKNKDILLLKDADQKEGTMTGLEYNSVTKSFEEVHIPENIDSKLFSADCELFPVSYTGHSDHEFLIYNSASRFDLKLAQWDAKGLLIESSVDFMGFPSDQNPKYYELLKLVPGYFTSHTMTSFVTVMRNCLEKTGSDLHCKKYADMKDLPNHVQLYNFISKQN